MPHLACTTIPSDPKCVPSRAARRLLISSHVFKLEEDRETGLVCSQAHSIPTLLTQGPTQLIKVLCEQTRELTDDLHNFLDYV